MHCPYCSHTDTKVIDSRLIAEGLQTRRRRECPSCGERFTTFETAELLMPKVIKSRNNTREPFNEEKLKEGQSFTQLAKTYSDDTGTAKNGGKMDWIKIGDTVLEFEKVAFALDNGELSQPVRTPYGLHLIQVIDRKTSS